MTAKLVAAYVYKGGVQQEGASRDSQEAFALFGYGPQASPQEVHQG